MDKPIQLIANDLREDVSKIINNTPLPMMCITPIVKEIYEQCIRIEKQQYEIAKQQYENSLQEAE